MSNASDFIIENDVLVKYVGPGGDVVIPDGVTTIRWYAFANCETLTSVFIAKSVEHVLYSAFLGCSKLNSVTIEEGLKAIDHEAFKNCKALTLINIPESVKQVGFGAFKGCASLADQYGFVVIRGTLFDYFGKCENVVLPDSVAEIDSEAFVGCESLCSIIIPESVTEIGMNTFYDCSALVNVSISDSVTTISQFAFKNCFSIRTISIANPLLLSTDMRYAAACAFVQENRPADDPRRAAYHKLIKANANKWMHEIITDTTILGYMCREKLITATLAPKFLEAARESGNVECAAMLLEYSSSKLSAKEKHKVDEKKQAAKNAVFERKLDRINKEGIDGLVFVASGKLNTFDNIKDLKVFIEENGGKLATSLSEKADFLVTNDQESISEKYKKAAELGVEIISEARLNEMGKRYFVVDKDFILKKYIGPGGEVILPSKIREIGAKAFCGCRTITQVRIPESVVWINEKAFYRCPNLTDVYISNRRIKFDVSVFEQSPKITIHGAANSHLENYAKKNSIPFVAE